jgi:hypothetical protein
VVVVVTGELIGDTADAIADSAVGMDAALIAGIVNARTPLSARVT